MLIYCVFAKHFCFLLLIFFHTRYPVRCQVIKCCPENFVLNAESDYFCESSINKTNWNAYNLPISIKPNCSERRRVFEDREFYIELNGCIDKDSNNQYAAISCLKYPTIGVHLMNKCCAIGQSYDHTGRFCVQNPEIHGYFKKLFGKNVVIFENNIPDCSEDEVFVEYFSTIHKIQFDGTNLSINGNTLLSDKFCIEDLVNIDSIGANESRDHIIIRSCRPRIICGKIPCIRRCCKADQVMEARPHGNKICLNHPYKMNLQPTFHNVSLPLHESQKQTSITDYGMLESWKCEKVFRLEKSNPDDMYYLNSNDGMLYMSDQEPYDSDNYCVENILTPNGSSILVNAFLCFDTQEYETYAKLSYYPYGLVISCIFLAVTLLVYLLLPKLLNLHGKTLVCYVMSFLVVYLTLAILQFHQQDRSDVCEQVVFFLLFFLMAAFAWQTVMCFDIWLTFGSLRSSFVMRHNTRNQRKFLYYSVYAWGEPSIWTLLTLYAAEKKPLPNDWNPNIGETAALCFFEKHINWKNHFLFFVVPAGVHIIINSYLFVMTAIRCSRVKSEIHKMQRMSDESNTSTKRRNFIIARAMFVFVMNLKLLTIMGVSWTLEIISTFSTNSTVETILDIYNLFLGVFIFIIFVFKRRVLYELKCRFGLETKNAGTATPRSTTITHTGNISMKDMTCTSDKSLPLLTASNTTLQVPKTG